jgi:NADP-dependent 3-hydroxy acid dehydrogenase YdfG
MTEKETSKRVIVTGASSGIGRATADLFLKRGARVALMGRREEALSSLAEGSASRAIPIAADLSDERETESCVARAVESLGGLDVLINSAGILKGGNIEASSLGLWDEMMNINLRSVFHLMKLAIPHLERSRGNVVNV